MVDLCKKTKKNLFKLFFIGFVGPFQKIQSILFSTDKTFIYDETLQTIFLASKTGDDFTSLIRADKRITSLDYDSCQK